MTSNYPTRLDRSSPFSSTVQTSRLRHVPELRDFKHVNVNTEHEESLTLGQRVADRVASIMGSWNFIISQSVILILWIILNTIALVVHWDSYPYILLNLALSFQAAFATPVILMSQNRQSEKDRIKADQDYLVNIKAEAEVTLTLERIEKQEKLILHLLEKIDQQEMREAKMLEKINVLITRTGRYGS
jgi:uncharacterized membrane protein